MQLLSWYDTRSILTEAEEWSKREVIPELRYFGPGARDRVGDLRQTNLHVAGHLASDQSALVVRVWAEVDEVYRRHYDSYVTFFVQDRPRLQVTMGQAVKGFSLEHAPLEIGVREPFGVLLSTFVDRGPVHGVSSLVRIGFDAVHDR